MSFRSDDKLQTSTLNFPRPEYEHCNLNIFHFLFYLYGVDGVDDDREDVEGSPGDEEHEGDQAEEYVGSLTSVLLTDGGDRWDLRATEIQLLLRLAEGEVDSEVGHGH